MPTDDTHARRGPSGDKGYTGREEEGVGVSGTRDIDSVSTVVLSCAVDIIVEDPVSCVCSVEYSPGSRMAPLILG